MKLAITLTLLLASGLIYGCNRSERVGIPDTLQSPQIATKAVDSTAVKPDTIKPALSDTSQAALPPVVRALDPAELAHYLPTLPDWTPSGDMQREIQIHNDFNKSRVSQTYTNGMKKLQIEINDFAYVPYLYEPWQKYRGTYLDDDNFSRTESSTISGFPCVQTMEKQTPHGEVDVLPGKRFVVRVVEDGATSIDEIRQIAALINLKGLAAIQ